MIKIARTRNPVSLLRDPDDDSDVVSFVHRWSHVMILDEDLGWCLVQRSLSDSKSDVGWIRSENLLIESAFEQTKKERMSFLAWASVVLLSLRILVFAVTLILRKDDGDE